MGAGERTCSECWLTTSRCGPVPGMSLTLADERRQPDSWVNTDLDEVVDKRGFDIFINSENTNSMSMIHSKLINLRG